MLGLAGVRIWRPEIHRFFPKEFRKIIDTLLMIAAFDETTMEPYHPGT